MTPLLTSFERLVLRALLAILFGPGFDPDITRDIDLAIRTSDGQQRADEAQKRIVP